MSDYNRHHYAISLSEEPNGKPDHCAEDTKTCPLEYTFSQNDTAYYYCHTCSQEISIKQQRNELVPKGETLTDFYGV
jgi:hypothetical protein